MLQMSIQHKQPYFTWQLISRVSEVAATVLGSRETSERNRSNEETRRLLSLSLYSSVAMAPSSHYESDNSDAQRGPLALIVSSQPPLNSNRLICPKLGSYSYSSCSISNKGCFHFLCQM